MKSGVKQDTPSEISREGSEVKPIANKKRENRTDFQVAKLARVSEDTIRKVEKIEKHATPEVKAAVKSGEEIAQSAQVPI